MSQLLTLELSEEVFTALRQQAEAAGVSPATGSAGVTTAKMRSRIACEPFPRMIGPSSVNCWTFDPARSGESVF